MGHKDFTMLVDVYAKWMDDWSSTKRLHIRAGIQNANQNAPFLPHTFERITLSH
jgi:integrase